MRNNPHDRLRISDLPLVLDCIKILKDSAKTDTVTEKFARILFTQYTLVSSMFDSGSSDQNNTEDTRYLSEPRASAEEVLQTERDLMQLVIRPFNIDGSTGEAQRDDHVSFKSSSVNVVEAAVGAHLEWNWELQRSGHTISQVSSSS